MALLSLRDVHLSFGGPALLQGVTLHIEQGERVCLLGRNGTGKSTLLKLLNGDIKPEEGTVERSRGMQVGMLSQEVPRDALDQTAREVLRAGVPADVSEEQARQRIERVSSQVGLSPEAPFGTLSTGWKRRVLLARALVSEPDLLLLDEPTNHLDIPAIDWLEGFLLRHVPTCLFVSHDRVFLDKLATRIVELDRGELYSFPGRYAEYEQRKEAALSSEQTTNAALDKKLAKEEKWLRRGVKARRARNEGRVRALQALRTERQARRERIGKAKLNVQHAERSGKLVIEAKNVSVKLGDKQVLRDVTSTLLRKDRVGIIGPNGCGKTTLLRILLGKLAADAGEVRQGTRLQIAYFDQLRAQLDEQRSVADNIADGSERITIDGETRHVLSYLESFLFPPERSRTPVAALSGGERNRLLLARLFLTPSNVLVMDEPTNDLDIDTLELLEQRLIHYPGTLLLVSHDRAFLNNVVTSTLAYDGDGHFSEYVGGYDDWQRQSATTKKSNADNVAIETLAAGKRGKPKTKAKRKLSFKESRELTALPATIEALEGEQVKLHEEMSNPQFYQSDTDGSATAKARQRLATIETELGAAYARWEALEAISELA